MIVCRSATGERAIAAKDFFVDTFQTAIEPTEILTEIRVRRRPRGQGGAYVKLERKVGDYATVGVAAITRMEGASIGWAGIGITGASNNPYAAEEAEAVLAGNIPSEDLFRRAGEAAAAQASRRPTSEGRSTTSEPWSPSSRSGHSARPSSAASRTRRRRSR